ncbi:MAG: glycosyltransferase family 2 protein [Deltaproteobacteria bacterium]|nr:glycosyltransferase family 2 protein [Deltaproteobacteria bacterium]
MRADLCVVAPCFNEGANVRRLVRRVGEALKDHPGGFELALVDDASRDDTWAQIEEAARAFPFVVPLRHRVNRGIVEGWRTGLSATKAPRIVTIDADMQYRPEDIPRLVRAMNASGADFVQGWRQTQVKRGFLRVFLTGGLSLFLNLAFGMRLKDNKSGFVLYRRDAMERILDFRAPFRHYQHFIAIAAHRLGLRIVQIPITFDAREHGQSFITNPVRFAIGALVDLPRALLHFGPFHRLMQGRA